MLRLLELLMQQNSAHVGEWVNFEAIVTGLGRSSINIKVEAYAEGRHDKETCLCFRFHNGRGKRRRGWYLYKGLHGKTIES